MRERRNRLCELVQIDDSPHDWLEGGLIDVRVTGAHLMMRQATLAAALCADRDNVGVHATLHDHNRCTRAACGTLQRQTQRLPPTPKGLAGV